MIIDWIRLGLEQNKAIISIVLLLLGISGVSIYGNVNEINPWRVVEEFVDEDIYEVPVKIVEAQIVVEPDREFALKHYASKGEAFKMIEKAFELHRAEYH